MESDWAPVLSRKVERFKALAVVPGTTVFLEDAQWDPTATRAVERQAQDTPAFVGKGKSRHYWHAETFCRIPSALAGPASSMHGLCADAARPEGVSPACP